MSKKPAIVMILLLSATLAFAQEAAQDPNVLKSFTRSGKFKGVTLFFVHMNNKTVEALFQAPTKYSMRARANMATMLYVQGTPDEDGTLNTEFTLEQKGQTTNGTPVNVKNFKAGPVVKGERIDGIIQFETKVDLSQPFTVKNADAEVEFKLESDALKLLEPPKPEGEAKK